MKLTIGIIANVKKLICLLIGHAYYSHQELTKHSRRVKCRRCAGDWGMNDDARTVIPWDAELEEFYKEIYQLRINP